MMDSKPILCLDFDGVIHSYQSGWKGPTIIPDVPVDGALEFIRDMRKHFQIKIFSSRSAHPGGPEAMAEWLRKAFEDAAYEYGTIDRIMADIGWPTTKPPALVTIDDRAIRFDGTWPSVEKLFEKPWNK